MWSLDQQHLAELLEMWDLRPPEMEDKPRLPEECSVAMNKVLSYELHISDAYLSMAYNSIDESVQPCFATFFEDQADVKRENGKEFLEYLGKYRNKICLPVFKRPEVENWGTGVRALECALELEDQLTTLLLDLKTTASAKKERGVVRPPMGKYLDKQKRNTNYLHHQIVYHEKLGNQAQERKTH
ncbi:ferritin, spleen middle subunit-like [Myotis yumanensis]|uniref:ferritin, spleen middle subunit-like n=1 Tax=Myotis yumanensis TaxID=159337 RepID=UPI0038D0AC45